MALTVWKSKQCMDPLGYCLFQENPSNRSTRSKSSKEIRPPVPGYPTMAANVMARVWNSVPGLEDASSVGAAKAVSRKWAKGIPR